jgi:hypothetical protein
MNYIPCISYKLCNCATNQIKYLLFYSYFLCNCATDQIMIVTCNSDKLCNCATDQICVFCPAVPALLVLLLSPLAWAGRSKAEISYSFSSCYFTAWFGPSSLLESLLCRETDLNKNINLFNSIPTMELRDRSNQLHAQVEAEMGRLAVVWQGLAATAEQPVLVNRLYFGECIYAGNTCDASLLALSSSCLPSCCWRE